MRIVALNSSHRGDKGLTRAFLDRILQGVNADKDRILTDDIIKVGPAGNFLAQEAGFAVQRFQARDDAVLQFHEVFANGFDVGSGHESVGG